MSSLESFPLAYQSGTTRLHSLPGGKLLKSPVILDPETTPDYDERWQEITHSLQVERQILGFLQDSPITMKYHGWDSEAGGVILTEASHGNLQQFRELHGPPSEKEMIRWSRQIVDIVHMMHNQGIIHCDLRPDNFLVHENRNEELDIFLCDFGGSICKELDVDGMALPTPAFLDPAFFVKRVDEGVDLFGLGFILYFLQTGCWPFRGPGSSWKTREETREYETRVQSLYTKGEFPDTEDLFAGHVMRECWARNYEDSLKVVCDLKFDIETFVFTSPPSPPADALSPAAAAATAAAAGL